MKEVVSVISCATMHSSSLVADRIVHLLWVVFLRCLNGSFLCYEEVGKRSKWYLLFTIHFSRFLLVYPTTKVGFVVPCSLIKSRSLHPQVSRQRVMNFIFRSEYWFNAMRAMWWNWNCLMRNTEWSCRPNTKSLARSADTCVAFDRQVVGCSLSGFFKAMLRWMHLSACQAPLQLLLSSSLWGK